MYGREATGDFSKTNKNVILHKEADKRYTCLIRQGNITLSYLHTDTYTFANTAHFAIDFDGNPYLQ